MTTLSLPADDATAAAFDALPPDEQERLTLLLTAMLRAAVRSPADRLAAFRRTADALGAEAQANGWNDDLDAALLRGDFDHDE